MEVCFKIDDVLKDQILKLYDTCIKIDLDNINFEFYNKTNLVTVALEERKDFWYLFIKEEIQTGTKTTTQTDIYKIKDHVLNYDYSEKY